MIGLRALVSSAALLAGWTVGVEAFQEPISEDCDAL